MLKNFFLGLIVALVACFGCYWIGYPMFPPVVCDPVLGEVGCLIAHEGDWMDPSCRVAMGFGIVVLVGYLVAAFQFVGKGVRKSLFG